MTNSEQEAANAKARAVHKFNNYVLVVFVLAAAFTVLAFGFDLPLVIRAVAAILLLLVGCVLMITMMLTMSLKAERKRQSGATDSQTK